MQCLSIRFEGLPTRVMSRFGYYLARTGHTDITKRWLMSLLVQHFFLPFSFLFIFIFSSSVFCALVAAAQPSPSTCFASLMSVACLYGVCAGSQLAMRYLFCDGQTKSHDEMKIWSMSMCMCRCRVSKVWNTGRHADKRTRPGSIQHSSW